MKPKPPKDPKEVDPVKILKEIAADSSAPAIVRVRACRALLLAERSQRPARGEPSANPDADPVTRRALEIAAERNRRLN